MKNIHVLPTDKPSRLHLQNGNLVLHRLQYTLVSQHIYITNDEEIKEECWVLNQRNGAVVKGLPSSDEWKKIILTDNPDLIKDCVQAIPDEFLEWFVKNPSCEVVAINTLVHEHHFGFNKHKKTYKIIIPKEEPKQSIILDLIFYKDEEAQKDVEIDWSGFPKSTQEQVGYVEPKQETLEEFAKRRFNEEKLNTYTPYNIEDAIIEGAKWQQQQNKNFYSEEEVYQILSKFRELRLIDFQEWFKQFKKK